MLICSTIIFSGWNPESVKDESPNNFSNELQGSTIATSTSYEGELSPLLGVLQKCQALKIPVLLELS